MPEVHSLVEGDPASIAGYRLVGRLGEGGQGTVWLGRDHTGRKVAVKVLHARLAGDAEAQARFRREIAAAQRVARFCTAQVLDADVDGDQPFIVTEYIDGPSLQRLVSRDGPRPEGALARLGVGMASALSAIHAAGIVHRDFKPGNVLLSPEGPRVVDFGIARILDATSTLTSQAVGTPAYMAPEQLDGRPVTPAVDLFAWGATMAYAATGRSPFAADSVAGVVAAILDAEPDLDGLTGPMRPLVESCLAKDPAARPSAASLLARLLAAAQAPDTAADRTRLAATRVLSDERTAPATEPAPPPAPPIAPPIAPMPAPPHRISRRGLLIGAGATAVAAAIGATLLLRDDRTIWSHDLHKEQAETIAANEDTVFLLLRSGALRALDAATGNPRWTRTAGATAMVLSAAGLFIAGANGAVQNLDPVSGQGRWSAQAETGGSVKDGVEVEPADPDYGGAVIAAGGDVVAAGGDVAAAIVPNRNGHDVGLDRVAITAFGTGDGRHLWDRTVSQPELQVLSPTRALAAPELIVMVLGVTVHAFSAATGKELWRFPLGGNYPGAFALTGDTLLIGGKNSGQPFYGLDTATGKARWQSRAGEFNGASLACDARTVYVAEAEPSTVHALDVRTGKERWRSTDVAEDTWGPVKGIVYGTNRIDEPTIVALDATTGKTLWRRNGRQPEMLAANGSAAFVVSRNDDSQTISALRAAD